MYVGVHLRNQRQLTDQDRDNIGRALVGGALAMWYHDPAAVLGLGLLPEQCVVRLPDSIYKHWPSGKEYIPSWQQYASDITDTIERFYEYGFRRFQVDNEPDLSWRGYVPPEGHTTQGDWAWFVGSALFDWEHGVRYSVAEDVELGMTPFSCPVPGEWYAAAWAWTQESTGRSLVELFDFVTAHCYWQAPEDMSSPQFGANYREVWMLSSGVAPIVITECGNSSTAPDAHERRMLQYPIYPQQVANDYYTRNFVEALYFYILGSNGDWKEFELDEGLCSAIGARAPLYPPRYPVGGGGNKTAQAE